MKQNVTVEFQGISTAFEIPRHFDREERQQFVVAAHQIDEQIFGQHTQVTLPKSSFGKRIVDALANLCKNAGYTVLQGDSRDEWILDVQVA